MIRPYRERRVGDRIRHLPLLTIWLRYGTRSMATINALVDSGAEHNVFPAQLAKRLGIEPGVGVPVTLDTIAGVASGRILNLYYYLGRHEWRAPAIFTETPMHQSLLGQEGFFEFFTVTFRRSRRDMSIRWLSPAA